LCWHYDIGTSINAVIPAKAGIQVLQAVDIERNLDSRLRGNDGYFEFIEVPIFCLLRCAWALSEASLCDKPSTSNEKSFIGNRFQAFSRQNARQ
jgi:hypothetical protein